MNYIETGGFQSYPLMRLTLFWTLLFLPCLWGTTAFMFFTRPSFTLSSVQASYPGSRPSTPSPAAPPRCSRSPTPICPSWPWSC